jgi:hypothetical protein
VDAYYGDPWAGWKSLRSSSLTPTLPMLYLTVRLWYEVHSGASSCRLNT